MAKYFDNNGNEVFYEQSNVNGNLITAPLYNAEIIQLNNPNANADAWYNSNIYLFRITLERYEQRYYSFSYTINVGYTLSINIILKSENGILEITYTASDDLGDIVYTDKITDRAINYPLIDIRLIPVYYANSLVYVLDRAKQGASSLSHNVSDKCAGVMFNVEYNGHTFNNDNGEIVTLREFDSTGTTEASGGYGTGKMPHDSITIPDIPQLEFSNAGSTMYLLNATQIKAFTNWLWTSDWLENLKKIRTDPMQNIIGVSIADFNISTGGTSNILVGNVNTGLTGGAVDNNFVAIDCGEITLDEYYGTFADYEPFVATTLYLPKVGFVQIPADVCVNNSIKVVYHIELSSGEGLCYVQLTSKRDGFTYIWNTYTCHVTSNITLSAQDHSQQLVALGNAIINTGISASNALVSPASAAQGLTNTLSSCIDVATTKNPTSTKGNVGNMSAVMCYKKPYLLINRTNLTKPSSFQENNGYLINYTATIGGHTGFLQTRNYHCSFNAPYNHRAEIEKLMDGGVIING